MNQSLKQAFMEGNDSEFKDVSQACFLAKIIKASSILYVLLFCLEIMVSRGGKGDSTKNFFSF